MIENNRNKKKFIFSLFFISAPSKQKKKNNDNERDWIEKSNAIAVHLPFPQKFRASSILILTFLAHSCPSMTLIDACLI